MRTRSRTVLAAVALLATLGLLATAAPAANAYGWRRNRPNIVELAAGNPDLSSLVAAVQYADANAGPGDPILADVLANGGPFTVFAPTNAAFAQLLADVGASQLTDVPADVVRDILLDHVTDGRQNSFFLSIYDFIDRDLQALGGLRLEFDRWPLEVNDIRVAAADVKAKNGVVHVIDAVLLEPDPRPNLVELAASTPDLSSLVAAVQYADANAGPGDPILADALSTGSPYTVFAPTNAAFAQLLADVGASQLTDVPADVVRDILLDHVVPKELDAKDVSFLAFFRIRVRTLGGLDLRFGNSTVNQIPIAAVDVEAENGTAHVITGVLLEG